MSKVKNLPLTLDEVLSCSETVMMQEAKVALIAMVKRQRRAPSLALPVGRSELCAKLGMDPAVGLEAIRQLVKLDYLHREGDNVQMVLGHPVIQALEVGHLNHAPAEELAKEVAKLLGPKPDSPKRQAAVARAVGKNDPEPEPETERPRSVVVPPPQATPAAEGNPDGGSVEPAPGPDQGAIEKAVKALANKKKASKKASKKRSKAITKDT